MELRIKLKSNRFLERFVCLFVNRMYVRLSVCQYFCIVYAGFCLCWSFRKLLTWLCMIETNIFLPL